MDDIKIPMKIFQTYEELTEYYKDGVEMELGLYVSEGKLLVGHTPTPYSFNPQYFTGNNELMPDYVPESPIDYTITATSNNTTYGYVTGGGTYPQHSEITLNAYAYYGYKFDKWSNGVETSAYTFAVEEDANLVGNFADNTYTVTTKPSAPGIGTTTGDGVYIAGTSVTVTATPAEGYYFNNAWRDEDTLEYVTAGDEYTFTVEKNTNLMAIFAPYRTVSATPNNSDYGSTTGSGQYKILAEVTITATAETGYRFVNWTEDGTEVSTSANYTFTVTGDRTFIANFEAATANINISANPAGYGSVDAAGSTIIGESYTVMAAANTGYVFVNWTEDGTEVSTSANYTFTVTGDRTLVANFIETFQINTNSSNNTYGTVSGSGTYKSGTSVTVTATPRSNCTFDNWTENGTVVSTSATYTFTATTNRTLVANFILVSPMISVSANPSEFGTVSGGGEYSMNASVTVTATPGSDYNFVNWTEGTTVVSTSATYTFTATDNRTLVANFMDPTTEPFYAENVTDSDITLFIKKNSAGAPTIDVQYSTDGENWSLLGSTSKTSISRTIAPGTKLYLRAWAKTWGTNSGSNPSYNYISSNGNIAVGGNITSLLYGSEFVGQRTFKYAEYTFINLLCLCENHLVDASKLILPTETVKGCYYNMFSGTNITSITLPAARADEEAYYTMFKNCRQLTHIKCLATSLGTYATYQWVMNVSATGTFVKKAGSTWATNISGIPSGWTVEEV